LKVGQSCDKKIDRLLFERTLLIDSSACGKKVFLIRDANEKEMQFDRKRQKKLQTLMQRSRGSTIVDVA